LHPAKYFQVHSGNIFSQTNWKIIPHNQTILLSTNAFDFLPPRSVKKGTCVQLPVGGASFVIGNTGYFGNGSGISQAPVTDLWQFTP
jgi:hypothetical protein